MFLSEHTYTHGWPTADSAEGSHQAQGILSLVQPHSSSESATR